MGGVKGCKSIIAAVPSFSIVSVSRDCKRVIEWPLDSPHVFSSLLSFFVV